MPWVCPTFQRPERLQELAASWRECQPGKKLYVRVWSGDERKEDYFKAKWPKEWVLYESDAEWCGDALKEFWEMHPNEPYYGFIADDIVLMTENGMEHLEALCDDIFIAYPNDHIQRHRLSTHFCVGGSLTRVLGYWILPVLRHHLIDCPFMDIGINTGLLRYAPQVVFHHNHTMVGDEVNDMTYVKAAGSRIEEEADELYWDWKLKGGLKEDVDKVMGELKRRWG